MRKIVFLFTLFAYVISSAQLKSPSEFLGYELGDKFTRHHRVIDYYEHVASNSDMVQLNYYGMTYEDRPLVLAYVASSENMARLETIRQDNLRRTGMLDGATSTNVSIVWLSYNVHGNEANSTEASMKTIYELVRPGSNKKDWLENTIVIIDPCINPDGRDRYVNFYWQYGSRPYNLDPQAMEHNEPWPRGRQNHYLFDLNRDWAWMTQVESEARIKEYNSWMPHVHVDFHEQGYNSPYYFAPAAEPYHELITDWQRELQVMLGKNHAKYFDEEDWFFFTRERFDLLYPSYGDTYPTYNGAIGMTYEKGGIDGGLGILTYDGDTLTLKDRLTHHHTTGLSTIEVTASNSDRILSEFSDFFNRPVSAEYKSFVVKNNNNDKIKHLKQWLDIHQIKYGTASNVKGLRGLNYKTKKEQSFGIDPGDLVVSVDQPKGILATILFEPETKLADSLTYDITAWSVPYFYGLEAYATRTALNVSGPGQEDAFESNEVPQDAYAFLFKWNSLKDAQFLSHLLKNNIRVRVNHKPLTYQGMRYERGSIIVTERDNKALTSFEQTIVDYANEFERELVLIETGYMDLVPDIGSSDLRFLEKPKIAMFQGDETYSTSHGATWYFFEQDLKYPITLIRSDQVSRVDLTAYDVLVMSNGRYSGFKDTEVSKISEWVSQGGKLILFQDAINKFSQSGYTSINESSSEEDEEKIADMEEEQNEREKFARYADRQRNFVRNFVPGAVFRVRLDNTHPLAYGYEDTYFTLKTSNNRFGLLESQNVGYIKSIDDHLSGFAGEYVRKAAENSLVFGVENKGRGQIVYFVDDVLFRAFWYNGKLMVANAIFYVGNY
jgi:hypothetical protein